MLDTQHVRQFCLDPAEATWVAKTLTRTLERSLNAMATATAPGGLPMSKATLYRKQRLQQASSGMVFSGRYPEALAGALAHHAAIPPDLRLRLVALLCAHWDWFQRSADQLRRDLPPPEPGMMRVSPYDMAASTVFGPLALFQSMTPKEGPLALALSCHQAGLGDGMNIVDIGPYLRFPQANRKRRAADLRPRPVGDWFASRAMPKEGWFLGGRAPEHLPLMPVPSGGHPPGPASGEDAYPWADRVTILDYLIYQLARTSVACIQEIREAAGTNPDIAIVAVKDLLAIEPWAPS